MPEFKKPTVTIEQLRKRYDALNNEQIRADANHKNARKALDELKVMARTEYGTDDLDALRAKLKEMETENDRKVADYQQHLDTIEANLTEVNQKFSQGEGAK
jgi:DNA repair exonuclease SbcCD ATPase subunit